MTNTETLQEALTGATVSTLESMCFAGIRNEPGDPGNDSIGAEVAFRGDARGAVTIQVSRDAAVSLAAGFLGLDEAEMETENMEAVLLEIANVICGRMLSVHVPDGNFSLSAPTATSTRLTGGQAECSFELDVGAIQCAARYEQAVQIMS